MDNYNGRKYVHMEPNKHSDDFLRDYERVIHYMKKEQGLVVETGYPCLATCAQVIGLGYDYHQSLYYK